MGKTSLTRVVLLAVAIAFAMEAPAAAEGERCGTKALHGERLKLHTMGKGVKCSAVKRITRGRCKVRTNAAWSCFSFRAGAPLLVWFPTEEMFDDDWSRWIEARRPPCSHSKVTARAWRRAGFAGFPTRRQVLADDLVRCRQLRGMRRSAVLDLLGKPDETDPHEAYWEVGEERDSLFQVDAESLTVRFDSGGRVQRASFTQD